MFQNDISVRKIYIDYFVHVSVYAHTHIHEKTRVMPRRDTYVCTYTCRYIYVHYRRVAHTRKHAHACAHTHSYVRTHDTRAHKNLFYSAHGSRIFIFGGEFWFLFDFIRNRF